MADKIGGTPRANKRPANIKAPAHWGKSKPVPKPAPADDAEGDSSAKNPVRYGDWESKGIAIDF